MCGAERATPCDDIICKCTAHCCIRPTEYIRPLPSMYETTTLIHSIESAKVSPAPSLPSLSVCRVCLGELHCSKCQLQFGGIYSQWWSPPLVAISTAATKRFSLIAIISYRIYEWYARWTLWPITILWLGVSVWISECVCVCWHTIPSPNLKRHTCTRDNKTIHWFCWSFVPLICIQYKATKVR